MLYLPILLLLSALSVPAQDSAPSGMILLVKGQVELARGGVNRPVRLGELLFSGDRLSVGDGEAVFVHCPLGKRMRLGPGTVALLSANQVKSRSGPEAEVLDDRECAIPKVALGAESLERIGGMRPRGKPPMTVYLGGRISTGRPVFRWRPVKGAQTYQISVSDELGRVIWSAETRGSSLDFPDGEVELADGWFSWKVTALNDSEIVAQQTTPLEIRHSDTAADGQTAGQDDSEIVAEQTTPLEIRHSDTAADGETAGQDELLLRAVELEDRGYFAEAASCLRRLGSAYPADERLPRRVAWLYWKAGLLPAFNEQMQALEAASGKR